MEWRLEISFSRLVGKSSLMMRSIAPRLYPVIHGAPVLGVIVYYGVFNMTSSVLLFGDHLVH
jgi:hypothetical protein